MQHEWCGKFLWAFWYFFQFFCKSTLTAAAVLGKRASYSHNIFNTQTDFSGLFLWFLSWWCLVQKQHKPTDSNTGPPYSEVTTERFYLLSIIQRDRLNPHPWSKKNIERCVWWWSDSGNMWWMTQCFFGFEKASLFPFRFCLCLGVPLCFDALNVYFVRFFSYVWWRIHEDTTVVGQVKRVKTESNDHSLFLPLSLSFSQAQTMSEVRCVLICMIS